MTSIVYLFNIIIMFNKNIAKYLEFKQLDSPRMNSFKFQFQNNSDKGFIIKKGAVKEGKNVDFYLNRNERYGDFFFNYKISNKAKLNEKNLKFKLKPLSGSRDFKIKIDDKLCLGFDNKMNKWDSESCESLDSKIIFEKI